MKPKNFPERKNQRRKGALARLLSSDGANPIVQTLIGRIRDDRRSERTKIRRAKTTV